MSYSVLGITEVKKSILKSQSVIKSPSGELDSPYLVPSGRKNTPEEKQDQVPKIGDIVLFVNEPCYKHELSAARVQALLTRRNGDVFGATITYRREVGGRRISVNRHLKHLYPFMGVEKTEGVEQINGLDEDNAAGVVQPGLADIDGESDPGTQRAEVIDEVSST